MTWRGLLDPRVVPLKLLLLTCALGLGQQGLYKRAVRLFQTVVDADGTAENWAAMGRLVLGTRDLVGARSAFDKALELDLECAEATFGLARILTFMGDLPEAARMCRRTLEIDPGNLEAYGQLSEVTGGRLTDEELARLEVEVEKPGMPADRLSIGLFALGDAYHRRKRRADAERRHAPSGGGARALVSDVDTVARQGGGRRCGARFGARRAGSADAGW